MRITKCDKGHWYDADAYNDCPHCNKNIQINPPTNKDKDKKREISISLIVSPVVNVKYFALLSSTTTCDGNVLFNGEIGQFPADIEYTKKDYQIKLHIHILERISPSPVIEYRSLEYLVFSVLPNELQKISLIDLSDFDGSNIYVCLSDKPIDLSKISKTISLL